MLGSMKPVKMHEAKTNLSCLIGLVEAGEEVIAQRDDPPRREDRPVSVRCTWTEGRDAEGQITIADDFDAIPEGFEQYFG